MVVVCHGPWPLEALQSVAAAKATPRQHNTCRHVDRPGCGPLPRPPNLEAGRSSSLPRKGCLVPRWVARGKNHNKTDASDPRPPATTRWALGYALVGFRFLPFQPPRGRNNMTRDGGPRVCMEVPRGRGIGHRNLSESLFKQRPAPSSQWNPIQVVGQTPPCLPPSPWC